MDTLLTFLLGCAVTMFFVRGYLKKLTETKTVRPPAARPKPLRMCAACGKKVEEGGSFCSHCGSPAAGHAAKPGAEGTPRGHNTSASPLVQ